MIRCSLAALALLAASVHAQVPPEHAVVLLEIPSGPARSALVTVDTVSGTVTPLSRFPFDDRAPLAVAIDPINDDVVVALGDPTTAGSNVLRLGFSGTIVTRFRRLLDTAFPVEDLAFGSRGDLFVAGARWLRVSRNGGDSAVITTAGSVEAAELMPFTSFGVTVERTLAGAELVMRNVDTNFVIVFPTPIPGLFTRVTGVHDLPTGAPRQLITDDLGGVHLFEFFSTLTTLSVTPALPPGATAALHGEGLDALIVGGASHPYMIRLAAFGSSAGSWQTVAGPFAGGAIDLDVARPLLAEVQKFGTSCVGGQASWNGTPTVGNSSFALRLVGAASGAPGVLVLGFDDQTIGGLLLPVDLVGGCPLRVSIDASAPVMADASGQASVGMPIPAAPVLVGTRVFGQWGVLSFGLRTSDGFVVRIGT